MWRMACRVVRFDRRLRSPIAACVSGDSYSRTLYTSFALGGRDSILSGSAKTTTGLLCHTRTVDAHGGIVFHPVTSGRYTPTEISTRTRRPVNRKVKRYLVWYTALGGTLSCVLALAAATATNTPVTPFAIVMLLVALLVGPLLVGVSDVGIDAAAAGATVGHSTSDPQALQPSSLPGFGRAALAFLLLGVGLAGALLLAVQYA